MDICECVYNSYLEVDLKIFKENVDKIKRHIGPDVKLMPVLKANAYAAGLVEMALFMTRECGVDCIAVAQVYEAQQMREAGVGCDILVMGGVPYGNIPMAVRLGLMTPAYNEEYLRLLDGEAAKQNKKARVHIKVETGLNRIGVIPGPDMDVMCRLLKTLANIEVVGAYTHFAESEALDKTFTLEQMEKFRAGVAQISKYGFKLDFVHAFNTASISWMKDPMVTHIRAAGIFFGYDTCLAPKNALELEEVLRWRAFVTNVKTIKAGDTVGYNRFFKAQRETKVATISVGFGDGYSRHLALFQHPDMLVNGKRVPVIGFCMDQAFLDVTGIDVNMNDLVTLVGRDGDEFISVFELQEKMGQSYLATIATIGNRVKRLYVR